MRNWVLVVFAALALCASTASAEPKCCTRNANDIATLAKTVEALSQRVDQLKTDLAMLKADLAKLSDQVNNLPPLTQLTPQSAIETYTLNHGADTVTPTPRSFTADQKLIGVSLSGGALGGQNIFLVDGQELRVGNCWNISLKGRLSFQKLVGGPGANCGSPGFGLPVQVTAGYVFLGK